MTDQELIARLREGATWDDDVLRDENDALAGKYMDLTDVLKAKLTKAVEVLREIQADGPSHGAIKYTLRAVLAELEKS